MAHTSRSTERKTNCVDWFALLHLEEEDKLLFCLHERQVRGNGDLETGRVAVNMSLWFMLHRENHAQA